MTDTKIYQALPPDTSLAKRFVFRSILPEEAEQAVAIETECFPPHEACKPEIMRARVAIAPERFLVAIYTDPSLHDPAGRNVMILGVNVLPAYRRQGLAREMVAQFLCREQSRGTERVILTCLAHRVAMYEGFGFRTIGDSDSTWGDEQWIEMDVRLNL